MDLTPSTPWRPRSILRPLSLLENLATIRQMLATLDSLTVAGKRHVMLKVLAFVETQGELAAGAMGVRNRQAFLDQVAVLKTESDRQLPSATAFGSRAENLIALLELGA